MASFLITAIAPHDEMKTNRFSSFRSFPPRTMDAKKPKYFSWLIENQLAAMGWPRDISHIRYLIEAGIKHLVTLSPDYRPPNMHAVPQISWTLIGIPEFYAPSIDQINQFIAICEQARKKNEPVGVHCRMGLGRTGVMLACYMVKFYEYAPERAIDHIRLNRCGSVETFEQERIVNAYNDYLCKCE